jgi:DNA-binding phage protein
MSPRARARGKQRPATGIGVDLIVDLMETLGVSRAELARRLDLSRVHVTQTLSRPNLTLATLQEMLEALGFELVLSVRPLMNGEGQ